MNIENLTFGELKQIASALSFLTPEQVRNTLLETGAQGLKAATLISAKPIGEQMVGKYCIARCYAAGVHAGEVVSVDGENVVLKNSRRLWSWKAKDGVALSGVAQNGLILEKSKLDEKNPDIYLTGVCELITCSEKARKSINEA